MMAARRHEERVSAGAGRWSYSGLRVWQAVTCECGGCGEDEGVAEALRMQHDEAVLAEVVLHARVSAGRGTPRERRGDEHAHALGSVAVGALADGMSIVPTRRADRAGA